MSGYQCLKVPEPDYLSTHTALGSTRYSKTALADSVIKSRLYMMREVKITISGKVILYLVFDGLQLGTNRLPLPTFI